MDYETPQFFRVIRYAREADRDVVDMVSGSPDWEPPTALREGLREYADADPADFQYPASVGLRELREEIAQRRGVDRERIVVTNGAGEANHLAMAGALDRVGGGDESGGGGGDGTGGSTDAAGDGSADASGDADGGREIVLADPVYPYYAGRVNFLDADPVFVPVEADGHLDPERVRAAASADTAAIVVNTPNNPTGAVYDPDAMAAFAEVAEAADALLVADEVYDHFDYTGRFESALTLDSPNVVVTNAFSKSMAITGFRVGYAVFPDPEGPTGDVLDRARTRHMLTTVTGSRPAQHAVLRALRETPPSYYADVRERLTARADTLCAALAAAGADYNRPEGGFYVMARFPDFPGTFENVHRLIDEAGVAGMPGAAFGESRADWIRFALVTDRVETAAERLADFFG